MAEISRHLRELINHLSFIEITMEVSFIRFLTSIFVFIIYNKKLCCPHFKLERERGQWEN